MFETKDPIETITTKTESIIKAAKSILIAGVILAVGYSYFSVGPGSNDNTESTKAVESAYNEDSLSATTSFGLSNADLAWHALNSYGYDCQEVIARGEEDPSGHFVIDCSSGLRLRVQNRVGLHPKITE